MTEFLTFIEKYKNRLVKHAFHRIGSLEEAEDIRNDNQEKMWMVDGGF
jgi:DNA-directed RNA polymerase specialized sigma24 family protein